MRLTGKILLSLLIAYSAVLVLIESSTSQQFVRNFFTDISGPVPCYGVNTTLSVFLLWGTSLLFAATLLCVKRLPGTKRLYWFCVTQIVVFAYLGIDDRFGLHESVAGAIGIGDHYILLAVGVFEAACLGTLGLGALRYGSAARWLGLAVLMFLLMIFVDAVVPHDGFLRLSSEDLAKTWSGAFFFLFAWNVLSGTVEALAQVQHGLPAAATTDFARTWMDPRGRNDTAVPQLPLSRVMDDLDGRVALQRARRSDS